MADIFGLFSRGLPRQRAGHVISAKAENAKASAIERSRPSVTASSGLKISQLPNSFAFATNLPRSATLARVTTTCPAATHTAYGAGGLVTIQTDNGTVLQDGPETSVPVKNLITKTVVSGTYSWVLIVRALDSWWVVAVYDCAMIV